VTKPRSLQHDLNRWVIFTAVVFVLVGSAIGGGIAFFEARELQDELLHEIALRVQTRQLSEQVPLSDETEESTIMIWPLSAGHGQSSSTLSQTLKDGLQTSILKGEEWRIFVVSYKNGERRFAVAQQTELRDEIALSSALNVFLPVVLLAVVMLLGINFVIRYHFKPLLALSAQLDRKITVLPEPLSESGIPEEILPFVSSINALMVRLKESMHKQTRFIADAAHELRTPVTALSLQVENIRAAKNDGDRQARQVVLQEGLERLRTLVHKLLDLARLQSQQNTNAVSVSFNQVIQDAIADFHPLAIAAQVDLGVTQLAELMVLDENGQLGQLVRNAVDNAIRYTPQGGQIDISLTNKDGRAVFIVDDSGPGIKHDQLAHVLEPFYRSPDTTQDGSGLGLAIAQEIALKLGGEIALSNRDQGGLRFMYTQVIQPRPAKNTSEEI